MEKLLRNRDINLDITNSSGETPLIEAIILNKKDIVKLLLDQDKNKILLNKPDDSGHTPLMWAILENNYPIFKLLIDQEGIDINKTNHNQENALFLAVKTRNNDMIKDILRKNVDNKLIHQRNIVQKTPLEQALLINSNNDNTDKLSDETIKLLINRKNKQTSTNQ